MKLPWKHKRRVMVEDLQPGWNLAEGLWIFVIDAADAIGMTIEVKRRDETLW